MNVLILTYFIAVFVIGFIAAFFYEDNHDLPDRFRFPMWLFTTFLWPIAFVSILIYGTAAFYIVGWRSLHGRYYA